MSKYIKLDDAIGIITEHQGIRGDTFKALHNAYAVDIVRCKECKYFKHGVRFNKPRYTDIENFCAYHMVFDWNANAFCSYGERIDDGDTI